MDTEVDWALSCLDKASELVVGVMRHELENGRTALISGCLFQAKLNINRAIEAITDSGVGHQK